MVNRVVPDEDLEREVESLVRKLAPTPLPVLRLTKIALVRAFAATPNLPSRVFASSVGTGVFESDDGGATWTQAGLGAISVTSLVFDSVAPSGVLAGSPNGVLCSPLGQVTAGGDPGDDRQHGHVALPGLVRRVAQRLQAPQRPMHANDDPTHGGQGDSPPD